MSNKVDYIAQKISEPISIDGNLTKLTWQKAQWSKRFVDMVTGEHSLFNTQTAIVWDDSHLYIAFKAEEPFVEAHLTARDSIIFLENDLELFIDGGDCYYELEVNAANTIYEVFFIWRDAFKNGKFDADIFDVHQDSVYTFGGDYDRVGKTFWRGRHPRGIRWAFTNFDMLGLETAVKVDGTLNNNSDIDNGWHLEIAIPWQSLHLLANGRSLPPKHGDVWNIFLGRFQKLVLSGIEIQPHPASALNAHGIYDTHLPDKWSRIEFNE